MRLLFGLLLASSFVHAAKTLDMYFIDVEGGQATLIVTPSKETLLVDSGWGGFNGRDADRIKAAAKAAGVKEIDTMVLTHYHSDHVGGITQLLQRIPIKTFIDHGPNSETSKSAGEFAAAWDKATATGKHVVAKPGDKIPLKGMDVQVISSNGEVISSPVNGGGSANAACEPTTFPPDSSDNMRSVGFLLTFGKFRFLDLGDLTSNKEMELACPQNKLGTVDLFLVSHHGTASSNAKPFVHGLAPRVAIMNNGARKGGAAQVWNNVKSSPGLEDFWQLHFAVAGGKEANVPDSFIANLSEACEGHYIKVSAMNDGSFTVVNNRNKYSKSYPAKR